MPHLSKTFTTTRRKFIGIWEDANRNQAVIEKNKEFAPIDLSFVINNNLKGIRKIDILKEETSIWYGSIPIINANEKLLEFIYPHATFVLRNKGVSSENIDILGGTFYYWYHKLTPDNFIFRFAVDSTLDTQENWDLNLSLILYNNRIYDNIQKSRI